MTYVVGRHGNFNYLSNRLTERRSVKNLRSKMQPVDEDKGYDHWGGVGWFRNVGDRLSFVGQRPKHWLMFVSVKDSFLSNLVERTGYY